MVKIWELLLNQKQAHKGLPVIIPLVVYHGREKWGAEKTLSHLFLLQDTALSPYIPDFEYIPIDWLKFYNHPIYFLETFVDTERFKGICY
ncbi:Rpn family recombination-promoting nuclease/putative transposase, partial [bacterium]|nr:Rpn family recombination-promoting nuclease/putative transposase [bacterium]